MNLKKWLYGLGAAIIGGGASSVTAGFAATVIDPASFNLHGGLGHTGELMAATFALSGLMHAMGYLAQSPLPPTNWDGQDRRLDNPPPKA